MRGASVVGASIWDSGNRWITIHGTNYLVVRDCVGYRSLGHGFWLMLQTCDRLWLLSTADGTTIAFNARYLTDVLTNVDADQFALELNGPLSPGVFRPLGDDHYVHVVMPVRTAS